MELVNNVKSVKNACRQTYNSLNVTLIKTLRVLACAALILNLYSKVYLIKEQINIFSVLFAIYFQHIAKESRNYLFLFSCFCVHFLIYLPYALREDSKVLAMKASQTEPSKT